MPNRENKSRNRRSNRRVDTSTNASLLKQIQLNTAASIAQQVPDTVHMPILKESAYSVILGSNTTFTTSTTLPVFPTLTFFGSLFNDFTNYSTVFDKYRILEVEVDFICVNPNNTGTGLFCTVLDYDDDSALSSLNQALDYKSAYSCSTNANFKRTLIPRIAMAAYSGSFTSYAEGKSGQWLDCASPGVIHYGLKCVINPTVPQTQYHVVVRAHIQFKNQH